MKCVIPENIHTPSPPYGWFFSLNPSSTPLEFPFQRVAGGPPHPPGISNFLVPFYLVNTHA